MHTGSKDQDMDISTSHYLADQREGLRQKFKGIPGTDLLSRQLQAVRVFGSVPIHPLQGFLAHLSHMNKSCQSLGMPLSHPGSEMNIRKKYSSDLQSLSHSKKKRGKIKCRCIIINNLVLPND